MQRGGRCALAAATLVLSSSCAGVRTAHRGNEPPSHQPPYLVQVVDAAPAEPTKTVSLSTYMLDPAAPPPDLPAPDVLAAMQVAAAARGAEMLYIERVDSPWRRTFYGVGLKRAEADTPVPTCAGEGVGHIIERLERHATRCLEDLRRSRGALRAHVIVRFQVDAFGDVYRAAATPESTRDTAAQRCVLEPVWRQTYMQPEAFFCALEVEARL